MSLSVSDLRAIRRFYGRQAIPLVATISDRSLTGVAPSLTVVAPSNPAIGSDQSFSFGRGVIMRPVWFQIDFVTSAVVNNRNVTFQITLTDYNRTIAFQNSVVQTAGSERLWTWIRGYPNAGQDAGFAAGRVNSFMADLVLKGPITFSTSTLSIDTNSVTGDHFQSTALWYEDLS